LEFLSGIDRVQYHSEGGRDSHSRDLVRRRHRSGRHHRVPAFVLSLIATAEPELQDVLRALDASRWQVIQKVGLPKSMPYFFASLKVAITVAFVGSISRRRLPPTRASAT